MTLKVIFISATWCKRCAEIKPEAEGLCKAAAVPLTIRDYDDMEEDDPDKLAVKKLPTIRMHDGVAWKDYLPTEYEKWKSDLLAKVSAASAMTTDLDF